nr:IS21 family transposase [Vulcanibacillus modesticaldus]
MAKKLGISRTTVYKYLDKDFDEISIWIASTRERKKKLDSYKDLILSWLKEHPDLSAAQIYDWLMEGYPGLKVGESTVRSYVRVLRDEYQILKTETKRTYQAIPDPPMGQQAQVDFGQTIQKTSEGNEIKLYFIAFVLSHSRHKYMEWLDRHFTTRDVIRAHENAFEYFEGIPHELVYDQDSLLVVSENAGDIIYTAEFQSYREQRGLHVHLCRRADPESKGKIENVVGFIKKNFAKHRIFYNLEKWNEQSLKWLERTGNGKVHNTTKKRPVEVFSLEKKHLRPVLSKINILPLVSSIPRTVRKDNTIMYSSNRYSVPLGTYEKGKKVYMTITDDERLILRESIDGPIIADHQIHHGKGQLIQATQHTRDRSKGVDAYINTIAKHFEDVDLAYTFLQEIRKAYPRYIRDQLQIISKAIKDIDSKTLDQALHESMKRKLFSATEFSDVVSYVKRQRQVNTNSHLNQRLSRFTMWDLLYVQNQKFVMLLNMCPYWKEDPYEPIY